VRDSTNNIETVIRAGASESIIGSSTNHDLAIYTNGAEVMRVLAGGNVGIGESAPVHKLALRNAPSIHLSYSGTASATVMGSIKANSWDVENTGYSATEIDFITGTTGYYGAMEFRTNGTNSTNTRAAVRMTINQSGTTNVVGTFTAGTKTFQIPHPLPELKDTHHLIHGCLEGPRLDLIYRGTINLVDGAATVDLDEASGMSAGTWELLCRDPQVHTSNETGWKHVRGSVSGSTLTITCEEATCTDGVSWMVVAERQDDAIKAQSSTDDDGHLILEPLMTEEDSPSTSASPSA